MLAGIKEGNVVYCKVEKCKGPIKPHITFFGESLPMKFVEDAQLVHKADLLIVIGTALAVGPFNSLVDAIPDTVPKVLINLENTASAGYDFDNKEKHPMRLFLKGKCDDVVQNICKECGLMDELRAMMDKMPKKEEEKKEEQKEDKVKELTD